MKFILSGSSPLVDRHKGRSSENIHRMYKSQKYIYLYTYYTLNIYIYTLNYTLFAVLIKWFPYVEYFDEIRKNGHWKAKPLLFYSGSVVQPTNETNKGTLWRPCIESKMCVRTDHIDLDKCHIHFSLLVRNEGCEKKELEVIQIY